MPLICTQTTEISLFNSNISLLLRKWLDTPKRKPLVLLGARQVGKTHALNELSKHIKGRTHVFDFEETRSLHKLFAEDIDPKTLLNGLEFASGRAIDPKVDLVIFDEIQACPRALTSLKYFSENLPELSLASAGSLLGLTLPEDSFPVGKVDLMYMWPLTFEEFLAAINDERGSIALKEWNSRGEIPLSEIVHEHLWRQLKSYFVVGGMPAAINAYIEHTPQTLIAFESARAVQEQLITMYTADMAKHSGRVSAMHIGRIWTQLPQQLASTADSSAPKYQFSGVLPTARGYRSLAGAIDWLENAGLIIKAPIANQGSHPLAHFTKDNVFKLFCFDVGILGALSKLHPSAVLQYEYGTFKGYVAENFVAQELLSHGVKPVSWSEATAQVEFVMESHGNIIPIEVKSGWVTQAKSLKVFISKYGTKNAVILIANPQRIKTAKSGPARYLPLYIAGKLREIFP